MLFEVSMSTSVETPNTKSSSLYVKANAGVGAELGDVDLSDG